MEKQDIITVIQGVRASQAAWIEQGQTILTGINIDKLEEPIGYLECNFSHWCESNKNSISAFPWFKDLQHSHENLHQAYSDLFFDSMRNYKPKTISELQERFYSFTSESKIFNNKLNDIEADLHTISNTSFKSLVLKSMPKNGASKDDTNMMQEIEIDPNPFDELESLEVSKSIKQADPKKIEKVETQATTSTPVMTPEINKQDTISAADSAESINRQVSLKEQSIVQLKQEKSLIELELSYLNKSQKLTQKSVKQMAQYLTLKQQEVDLDQKNNNGFIAFKNDAKKQAEDELAGIKEKTATLKEVINNLVKENVAQQLEQSENQETSMKKQFEELKSNQNKSLRELQEYKKSKWDDLVKLQKQVMLLEKDISDMEQDINKKQHDLLDLEEKEKLINVECSIQEEQRLKLLEKRNNKIADMQKELTQLSNDEQLKQDELNTVHFQIKELSKNGTPLLETNCDELKSFEQQQACKHQKLSEIEVLKTSKHVEIKDIDVRIIGLERSLLELQTETSDINDKAKVELSLLD